MKQVNYILVDETSSKTPLPDVQYRDLPHVGHCCIVNCNSLASVVGKSRLSLISCLAALRRKHPETPILGLSELDTSSTYAPVRVNPEMNRLRKELSGVP